MLGQINTVVVNCSAAEGRLIAHYDFNHDLLDKSGYDRHAQYSGNIDYGHEGTLAVTDDRSFVQLHCGCLGAATICEAFGLSPSSFIDFAIILGNSYSSYANE